MTGFLEDKNLRPDDAPAPRIEQASAEAHVALGDVLVKKGHLGAAIESYNRALALSPDLPLALTQLGRALARNGEPDAAEEACRKAIAVDAGYHRAHLRLGRILLYRHRVKEAFQSFTRAAEILHRADADPTHLNALEHKSKHDLEQREYLSSIGSAGGNDTYQLAIDDGRELNQSALGLGNRTPSVTDRWKANSPQIVVLDDFLTDEALNNLRQFCAASTIWDKGYQRGYVEAFLTSGISCPLLAQIADELSRRYPAIFNDEPLWMFWGFKYDSSLSGVGTHADSAVINVNFWITPDDANLDPESGGLIVWDKSPPSDWDADRYNSSDTRAAREFLESSGARPVTIPYRSNRAVIFDSGLFHETDRIHFREGYLNRRINLTLLYGRGKLRRHK